MSEESVYEIIYSVIQVEKDGAEFYRKLAGQAGNQAVRDVFLDLANAEIQHQKDFQGLARDMKDEPLPDSATNLVEILSSVTEKLKNIIKGSELVDMKGATMNQALGIGIHNEKESIRIYSELLGIRYSGFAKILRKIIDEEKEHLAILEKMQVQSQRL